MKEFAMIFPGQGSQSLGMLLELAKENYIVEETFKEASDVLSYDLWKLIQHGTKEELNKTHKTQPALVAASTSIFRIWKKNNFKNPVFMAGHSLGEYSALVCANVIKFKDAIKLVDLRGKLMQSEIPEEIGAMHAIIGLNSNIIKNACKKASQGQIVSISSFNSYDQIVISGEKSAVERASIICKKNGAKRIIKLPISVPSHCELMKPASKKLEKILNKIIFFESKYQIINNVDVKIEKCPNNIRNSLVRQLYNPVRWTETIELIAKQGIKYFIEIGPGNVLSSLTKRIIHDSTAISINNPTSFKNFVLGIN
ncbi:ACP S-malonyltransferase [Candidatus Providencia siddallii]|uniref:Malonyl CoA-acyl carrier protein transacylase n=1 Tax=Candidatus Providencia siddallii TaxID=1715285 RepID=A0ABM9NP62_9GAMM